MEKPTCDNLYICHILPAAVPGAKPKKTAGTEDNCEYFFSILLIYVLHY